MGTWNKERLMKFKEAAEGARHNFEAVSSERGSLIGQKESARQVLEKAERGKVSDDGWRRTAPGYDSTERFPTPDEAARAKQLLDRLEHLDRRYHERGRESARKSAFLERLTNFLIEKGVRDPFVTDQVKGHYQPR